MIHNTIRRATLAVALALLGGSLAAGPAAAQSAITSCPRTLIAPGTYTLAADLTCPGTAITIAADNVRLFLNGRSLTAATSGSGFGVFARGTTANPTLTGLSIQGPGTVRNFQDGVHLEDAPGVRVLGVTATGNGDDGIQVEDSPGARVGDNVLTGNGFGTFLVNCVGCDVSGNQVSGSRTDGILASTTPRSRFTGNTVTGAGDDGFDVNGCSGCLVSSNRATGNGDAGIELFNNTTRARLAGNTLTNNGGQGIDLTTGSVDGNSIQANTTTGNRSSGIRVAAGATGNQLAGNRATGNTPVDLTDNNPPASPCANAWVNNVFVTDSEGNGPGAGCIR